MSLIKFLYIYKYLLDFFVCVKFINSVFTQQSPEIQHEPECIHLTISPAIDHKEIFYEKNYQICLLVIHPLKAFVKMAVYMLIKHGIFLRWSMRENIIFFPAPGDSVNP